MWKYILAAILLIVIIVITIAVVKKRRNAAAARLSAAAVLLRERKLNDVISRYATQDIGRYRPVLELTWKDKSGRRAFLFDPSSPVRIGKDPGKNNICIRNASVSAEHCLLVMHKGALTLQDLSSRNGTYVRRRGRRYRVDGRVYVSNGDRIEAGSLCMKVNLFMYDVAYI